MECKGCFARFGSNLRSRKMLPKLSTEDWLRVISTLAAMPGGGVSRKINFVGGEPLLIKDLPVLLAHAKKEGFTTSLVTNASLLSRRLKEVAEHTDWVGISIDSFDERTTLKLGRHSSGRMVDYLPVIGEVKAQGIKVKINTVVSHLNWDEDMSEPLQIAMPDRWKVLRLLLIDGENDSQTHMVPTDSEFTAFVTRHSHLQPIVEDNDAMRGSYLMVGPDGFLLDNSSGPYRRITSLLAPEWEGIGGYLDSVGDRMDMRGGVYDWA